jgi:hypothetical protein
MGALTQILAAFGLSAASGLNAYIPLLVVGLAARFTDWFKLSPPFDLLANEWVLAALAVLLFIEMFVDKIPGLDHLNDIIQTLIRPAAGAVLFASEAHVITNLHPAVAVILGLLVAFSVHTTKAAARPLVTAGTLGTGNWLVSLVEDIISVALALTAVLVPVLLVGLFVLLLFILFRWNLRRARRLRATAETRDLPLKWRR